MGQALAKRLKVQGPYLKPNRSIGWKDVRLGDFGMSAVFPGNLDNLAIAVNACTKGRNGTDKPSPVDRRADDSREAPDGTKA